MNKSILSFLLGILIIAACTQSKKGQEGQTADQEPVAVTEVKSDSAYVFFKYPEDGSTVPSPVFVQMGVSGMQIEPAGVVKEGYGHHHILINQSHWPEGEVIPMSDSTLHYGKGQTDASLELDAGTYTLSLQFADGVHASYGKPMAASITITVE